MVFQSKKLFLLLGFSLCTFATGTNPSEDQKNNSFSGQHNTRMIPRGKKGIQLKPLYIPKNRKKRQQERVHLSPQKPVPEWLVQSSIKNAPPLLKGIFHYLKSRPECALVSSFHRLLLVGPPGTGKTTLAQAIAHTLGYCPVYIAASTLLGRHRNQTAIHIRNLFKVLTKDDSKKAIIIDELHKLFEHYGNDKTDHSENAAAFWLELDKLEKQHPNIIVIGTANEANKLPPEIKSRFHGKIIAMPLPDKQQKIQAFKDIVRHDTSVLLDNSVDDVFIVRIITKWQDCSLRDVQLLVDTAKMFKYAESGVSREYNITLSRTYFLQALQQLHSETDTYKKGFIDRVYPEVKKWALFISVTINSVVLSKMFFRAAGGAGSYMFQWQTA